MSKIGAQVNKLVSYFIIAAGMVMTVIVIVQVFCRYVLGFSIFWSEELARYLLVWITFLGGSVAFKRAELASINLIVDRLPARLSSVVSIISQVIVLIFLLVATQYGFKQAFAPSVLTQVSPAMRLPMKYAYLAVPVGFGIMILHCLDKLLNDVRLVIKGEEEV